MKLGTIITRGDRAPPRPRSFGGCLVTHDPSADTTLAVIDRFNTAFNRHDVDAVMALMTDDCVFETTGPGPDGKRCEGQAAVRAAWVDFFAASPTDAFTAEEMFAAGDRGVV